MNYVDSFNLLGIEVKQIPCIVEEGTPTAYTAGATGMFYMDSSSGELWKCTGIDSNNNYYLWAKLIGNIAPDWYQNDPAANGFIKNRPFYISGTWKMVHSILASHTGQHPITGVVSGYCVTENKNILEQYPSGTICKVRFDDQEYIAAIHDSEFGKYLGNGSYLNTAIVSTNESFVIYSTGLDMFNFRFEPITMISDSTPVLIELSALESGIINKLNPIYLPDNLLKTEDKEDLENAITDVEGKIIGKAGSGQNSEKFNDNNNVALGDLSHSEGRLTKSVGRGSHAEGDSTIAGDGNSSLANNISELAAYQSQVPGAGSHAEGIGSLAKNAASHAEGFKTQANGNASHSEGQNTTASGIASHSEGLDTIAEGNYSHSEGAKADRSTTLPEVKTTASGYASHAEGLGTRSQNNGSHSEGVRTIAVSEGSHAEGSNTTASGKAAHAEGMLSVASGTASHAEGYGTKANAYGSHAEGIETNANGIYSHAEGGNTIATAAYSHVQGKYNEEDTEKKYAHIVGGGSSDNRKNIHTVDWNGNAWYEGGIKVGGRSQDDESALPVLTRLDTKPLLLNEDMKDTYLTDPTYGDTALECIKAGRQILVRVPNSVSGGYTVNYSPVYMYQVPNHDNNFLYLFYLTDRKNNIDLTQLGLGMIQVPIHDQLKMILSKTYNNNPLEE